jgi:hypothetical protein
VKAARALVGRHLADGCETQRRCDSTHPDTLAVLTPRGNVSDDRPGAPTYGPRIRILSSACSPTTPGASPTWTIRPSVRRSRTKLKWAIFCKRAVWQRIARKVADANRDATERSHALGDYLPPPRCPAHRRDLYTLYICCRWDPHPAETGGDDEGHRWCLSSRELTAAALMGSRPAASARRRIPCGRSRIVEDLVSGLAPYTFRHMHIYCDPSLRFPASTSGRTPVAESTRQRSQVQNLSRPLSFSAGHCAIALPPFGSLALRGPRWDTPGPRPARWRDDPRPPPPPWPASLAWCGGRPWPSDCSLALGQRNAPYGGGRPGHSIASDGISAASSKSQSSPRSTGPVHGPPVISTVSSWPVSASYARPSTPQMSSHSR